MFERLKEELEDKGELMIITGSGEEHEIHKHNTTFEDGFIKVDADDEIHWLKAESIERYWIHKDF